MLNDVLRRVELAYGKARTQYMLAAYQLEEIIKEHELQHICGNFNDDTDAAFMENKIKYLSVIRRQHDIFMNDAKQIRKETKDLLKPAERKLLNAIIMIYEKGISENPEESKAVHSNRDYIITQTLKQFKYENKET